MTVRGPEVWRAPMTRWKSEIAPSLSGGTEGRLGLNACRMRGPTATERWLRSQCPAGERTPCENAADAWHNKSFQRGRCGQQGGVPAWLPKPSMVAIRSRGSPHDSLDHADSRGDLESCSLFVGLIRASPHFDVSRPNRRSGVKGTRSPDVGSLPDWYRQTRFVSPNHLAASSSGRRSQPRAR